MSSPGSRAEASLSKVADVGCGLCKVCGVETVVSELRRKPSPCQLSQTQTALLEVAREITLRDALEPMSRFVEVYRKKAFLVLGAM